jgi:hypothetical protein
MEKHNGVLGGCWCVAFHPKPDESNPEAALAGGGTVDGYPIATRGKPYSSSFLFGGTESMFAEAGFRQVGALGTTKVVMRRRVRGR